MKGFLIMACLAATFISFLSLVEHGRGQQISNPAFMLLWKSTVGATKRHARVDMRKLMEPLLNPPSSNEKRGTQQGFEANVVPQDSLQQIYGTGPLGLIEIQSAMASFNRPLFDYDSLVQQAYVVEYQSWLNSSHDYDKWNLWSREKARRGSAPQGEDRKKRLTDDNGFEENWIGRSGLAPFKVTKQVDQVSPELFIAALNTNQVGPEPTVFEVVFFFRLGADAMGPYTLIHLHHAILAEYQLITSEKTIDGENVLENFWFDFAAIDYSWVSTIQGACTPTGCPPNASTALNCGLGILYDFPVSPVYPGC